tara:strand:+ start:4642 stop:5091 length:450 start_codon:yes stop_codon:yes gene_type:complete
LNFILFINKKKFLFFIIFFILIFFSLIFFSYFKFENEVLKINSIDKNNSDITKPKFSINGNGREIYITAKNGNFLDNEKILLEKDVNFKSKEFHIVSENVIFDRKNLVASSNHNSKFTSRNTLIISKGFDIIENGNVINFKGKTTLKIK